MPLMSATFVLFAAGWHGTATQLPRPVVADRSGVLRMAADSSPTEARPSFFPAWPDEAVKGRRDLPTVLESFDAVVTSVPLKASSEQGSLAGCQGAHHALILSRQRALAPLSGRRQRAIGCDSSLGSAARLLTVRDRRCPPGR